MFNIIFDIENVWIITMIIVIIVLLAYIYISSIFRRKKNKHIRLYSNYTQTDAVTIVEYDVYGQPYINGYQAVLYSQV